MNETQITRRSALARTGLLTGAALLGARLGPASVMAQAPQPAAKRQFLFCLNTATIRGQKLGIVKEIEAASQAGYDAIEPWVDSIASYVNAGGKLPDLKKRISDCGLTVEDAIAFPEWLAEDDTRRVRGLEEAKRQMEMVAQIGGKRIAAPPSGATGLPRIELAKAADRYRTLLEAGDRIGVVPQLELWGFSKNLGRLGECVCVAMETGHPRACVLADVFHLYKGGSDVHALRLLGPDAVQVLHMNDYPAEPPREKIEDGSRVFPGDGVAPLTDILAALHRNGGTKVLSLELFNRKYWSQDAVEVARTGLAKMKAALDKALG